MDESSIRDDFPWFVAQLKPNGLNIAKRNLQRQGFTTFMPLQASTRRSRNKLVETVTPVFPGYIFVGFAPDARWSAINSTFGIARLITGPDAKPSSLPVSFMKDLRARCDDKQVLTTPDDFQVGEDVKIISGPFANIVGRIEKLKKSDRVSLLLELMGQSSRVDVPSNYLLRA